MIVRGKVSRTSNGRGNRVVPRIFPSLFRDGFFISAAPVKSTFPHAGFRIPEPIEKDTGPDTRAI